MSAITKADLTEDLINALGMNRQDAKQLIEVFFSELRTTLGAGESVRISSFGNFELRDKSSRPGRNPKTGEEVIISARRVVTFKPGHKLRNMIELKHLSKEIAPEVVVADESEQLEA